MSVLAAYLRKNIKLAANSVYYNRKKYLCFFIAMFVVEIFCGLVVIASHNNNAIEYKYVSADYGYHLKIIDLNSDQYVHLYNANVLDRDETKHKLYEIYDIVSVEERTDLKTEKPLYTVYLKFTGDPQTNLRQFTDSYIFKELGSIGYNGRRASIDVSELFNYEKRIPENVVINLMAFSLVTALSVLLVMSLYSIRINHYKFEYGIYMTFGADFRRLFSASMWEMLIVAFAVYLPAVLTSATISYLIYTMGGESFSLGIASPFIILLFAVIVSGVSVFFPVRRLSRRTPINNIIAEDNSNFVVSPRISFEMLGARFPNKYVLFTAWRFRRYNLKLFATAAAFTALFVLIVYASGLIKSAQSLDRPQFRVDFTSSGPYDGPYSYDGGQEGGYMHDELCKISGVTGVKKTLEVVAGMTRSHVLFDKSDVAFGANFVSYGENNMFATNFAKYIPADSEVIDWLSKYEYEGDLNSVLTNEKTVIISDSASNAKKLNIKPGATIRVAKFSKKIINTPTYLTGNKLLKEEFRLYAFDYTEYTVGAVLKNIPTDENIAIYFSDSDFTAQTGNEVKYNSVDIYIDQNLSVDEVKRIEGELQAWSDFYSSVKISNTDKEEILVDGKLQVWKDYYVNAKVTNLYALGKENISAAKNAGSFTVCMASLLLVATPLLWFFPQILFYFKRENEFNVLTAFGGLIGEVKKLHIIDGIIAIAGGGILLTLFIWAFDYAAFAFANWVYVPYSGFELRYVFELPWPAVIAGVLIFLACAFLSCYIAFLLYAKRTESKSAAEFGEE